MNTLHSISDQDLLTKTEALAAQERKIHADLLRYLRELDRRRLYLELGYDSLYGYCIKHLKLSEGAASRRISSMRLIRDLPESEKALRALGQGSVSLSTLSATQRFLKQEKKSHRPPPSAERLLEEIQGRSQNECELLFARMSPEAIPHEKLRVLTETQTEVRFVMTTGLKEKLQKIRSLLSHQMPDPSYSELLEKMAEIVLKQIDPEKKPLSLRKKSEAPKTPESPEPPRSTPSSSQSANGAMAVVRQSYIPAPIRQAVWRRDGGACVFADLKTGRRCGSTRQIQLDHIIPAAKGGPATIENLRCLCKSHNLYAAIQVFGPAKMAPFLVRQRASEGRPMPPP